MNALDTFYFAQESDEAEEDSDYDLKAELQLEYDKLDKELRKRRAPVVKPAPEQPFPFMRLPQELREQVYDEYFRPEDRLELYESPDGPSGRYEFEFALLRTSKQIWFEALRSWRKNVFVRIETPWPHAVHHIQAGGQVPIVASGPRADSFNQHTALVQVTAPLHGVTVPDYSIILLLHDLHSFTRVWYYSALNYTNLNTQICLTFTLRDPYYPADPKPVPLSLQRKLLLPFGDVKGLYQTEFEGFADFAIQEVRTAMIVPYPTVQESCERATTLMEEGDLLLATNNPEAALASYINAFDAIHIKILGRSRRVLADGHFSEDIVAGRYAGQAAMTVRVILRISLVARVVHAYLLLSRPEEAAFWGVRSIKLMRHGTSPTSAMEDFFSEFIGSADMACLYAWTAAALTLMEREERYMEEREAYKCEDEQVTDPGALWWKAGAFLGAEKYKGERKRVVEEVRRLGVRVPAGVFEDVDEVDSMVHLDLGAAES
ncbi:hypothetical protein BU23DRAFT_481624 [Bimuria novae-zelandiae CBS 107.79]|uniref:Uncharacterized protein n=1 Tax=Bimuria novae-zelandiae CBS 107.79 TaxID=1447943 RepID=A0A6A5UT91_9PLEO|nr:hypothetical protein BU23DRAFT_481624 [Bimuria novae-zelandiae CBS 107.79]